MCVCVCVSRETPAGHWHVCIMKRVSSTVSLVGVMVAEEQGNQASTPKSPNTLRGSMTSSGAKNPPRRKDFRACISVKLPCLLPDNFFIENCE